MSDFEDFEWNGIGKRCCGVRADYITITEYEHSLYEAWREVRAWSMQASGGRTIARIGSVRLDVEFKG